MIAQAFGASRSIHSQVVMGWPVSLVGSEGGPVTLGFIGFVGNRSFHDENEWIELALRRPVEALQKFVAVFVGEEQIVKVDFGNPRQIAEHQIFDARLRRPRSWRWYRRRSSGRR